MPSSDSTQASICGFDIGSENCYIGIARQGGIEIILNEYSQRSTPAYISLGDKQRELGVSAKQKHMMNISNTFFALKRLVGRQYNEVSTSENLPFPIEQSDSGEVAVRVCHNDQEYCFSVTQLLAMLFTKLRQIAHNAVDCVINCPNYFTDGQRRALYDAALIAGLNPLRILSDMTAVGIYYCFYRLGSFETSSIVAFIDVGNTTTQCAIIYFDGTKKSMQLLSVEYESNIGGKHFDQLLANHFIQQHNLNLNKRARLRLEAECEKLKKQMSANSNSLPISIECLYEDRDFSSRIDRAQFEAISEQYFTIFEALFKRALDSAVAAFENLQKDNKDEKKLSEFKLSSVEVVGGASRIPAIKRIIKDVFGQEASTTLNADEVIAQGCALQCAMLSPSFKVAKQLQVLDFASYQINCKYWHVTEAESKTYSINPLFNRGEVMPYTRQITVNCKSLPMLFEFEYVNANGATTVIGQFQIDLAQKLKINNNKVKVRARLDNNGLISLVGATLLLEDKSTKNQIDDKGDDTIPCADQGAGAELGSKGNEDAQENKEEGSNQATKENEKKSHKEPVKSKVNAVDLVIQTLWIRGKLSDVELAKAIEVETNLILSDKNWKDRLDARNELEEYVYEWRDKLEDGRMDKFTTPHKKQDFMKDLKEIEQWLYDDEESGGTMSRSVYVEKLDALKNKYSNGIKFRSSEFENRTEFLEKLGKAIQMGEKLSESNENIEEAKLKKLHNMVSEKQKWFDECHTKLSSASLSDDPPVTTSDIKEQIDALESMTQSIYNDIQRKKLEKQREEEKKKFEEKVKKKEAEKKEENKKDAKSKNEEANTNFTPNEPMDVD